MTHVYSVNAILIFSVKLSISYIARGINDNVGVDMVSIPNHQLMWYYNLRFNCPPLLVGRVWLVHDGFCSDRRYRKSVLMLRRTRESLEVSKAEHQNRNDLNIYMPGRMCVKPTCHDGFITSSCSSSGVHVWAHRNLLDAAVPRRLELVDKRWPIDLRREEAGGCVI